MAYLVEQKNKIRLRQELGWSKRGIATHLSLPCSTIHGYLRNNSKARLRNNSVFSARLPKLEIAGVLSYGYASKMLAYLALRAPVMPALATLPSFAKGSTMLPYAIVAGGSTTFCYANPYVLSVPNCYANSLWASVTYKYRNTPQSVTL